MIFFYVAGGCVILGGALVWFTKYTIDPYAGDGGFSLLLITLGVAFGWLALVLVILGVLLG